MIGSYEGPYFDDLEAGAVFTAPAYTLTDGRAAVHQSILGSRLPLTLDTDLAMGVAGLCLADPGFVWDVAIGQSTVVTQRVIANLFYRGLAFHRLPAIGDTLRTRTEIVGLRQNASRPSGMAALRITTIDQHERPVLDFWRCAMLPLRDESVRTGHSDDLSSLGHEPDIQPLIDMLGTWDLARWAPPEGPAVGVGATWASSSGELVSGAAELARLTLNLAHVHHDQYSRPGGRLVYGGHTIGLALTQVAKALPQLITVAGWRGCDHTGPVREGDTLYSEITVEAARAVGDQGLRAVDLRVIVKARDASTSRDVLDWRPIVILR
ncbi:MAG: acyl dehydratase [Actinobacteria bacterium 69-20]|nr:acyl dehydratase [Actinomycetota bacterium]OJV24879.1 MAG: acyl dehydratase [Actinobacteria bacterium 69-20]